MEWQGRMGRTTELELGVLLGSLQTILDENIELIATIERRRLSIYILLKSKEMIGIPGVS